MESDNIAFGVFEPGRIVVPQRGNSSRVGIGFAKIVLLKCNTIGCRAIYHCVNIINKE